MHFRRVAFLVVVALITASPLLVNADRDDRAQTPQQPRSGGKKHLALVGGMLIDGYEVPPMHHAAILVEDDRIVEIGPAAAVKIPADATIIDTSGRTMMPGLIEEHAHINILGHGDYSRWYPWITKNGYVEKVMEIS